MRINIGKLLAFSVVLFMGSCSDPADNPLQPDDSGNNNNNNSTKTLVVTEILYNSDEDSLEFIEIKNVSSSQVSLKGTYFSEGIDFKFADDAVIEKGQYLVLTNSKNLFETKYPDVAIAGVYKGRLNNSGDGFELTGPDSNEIFSVAYETSGFWPVLADGLGHSLVTVNESDVGDQNDYNDWIASASKGGSPGAKDQAKPFSPVYVNEVMVSTLTDRKDQIELFNPSLTESVDVSNFFITDDRKKAKKFKIPAGSVIEPNGYLVLTHEHFGDSVAVSTGGGFIYLYSANANGDFTGYTHGINYEDNDDGATCGLIKNSDGLFFTCNLITPTIGSANSDARMGSVVISEIMYHPEDRDAEFIEIVNVSDDSIPLFSADSSWKVKGVAFEFPSKTTLPPNAVCLLIDISHSVSEFKTKYDISSTVLVFQYDGKLSNDSEMIALEKPGKTYQDLNGIDQTPYITVDAVLYNDRNPWPRKADGDGYSLTRRDLTKWGNEPSNWRASDLVGGTPGEL